MFSYLKSLFAKKSRSQSKGVLLGLDCTGKTTLLHRFKNAEVIMTIPTIGLNIETIETDSWHIASWDVGGCSKTRPLFRHFYTDSHFMIFMINCSDEDTAVEAMEEVKLNASEFADNGGTHLFVMLNKTDLLRGDNKEKRLEGVRDQVSKAVESLRERIYVEIMDLPELNCKTGKQLDTALARIKDVLDPHPDESIEDEPQIKLLKKKQMPFVDTEKPAVEPASPPTYQQLIGRIKDIAAIAEPDDNVFWNNFLTADLPTWDHYTHLRAGYFVVLEQTLLGADILGCADEFVKHLERLHTTRPDVFRNTTHRTMTVFWLAQILHAAKTFGGDGQRGQGLPSRSRFRDVLIRSPELMDGGLWKGYYSKEVIFSKDARAGWRDPDLKGLEVEIGGWDEDGEEESVDFEKQMVKM